MAVTAERGELLRIEDFIVLASEGKQVTASIGLRKQPVLQKVHPDETEEMKEELDMYLLLADYTFGVGSWRKIISKVYVYGSSGGSLNESKINVSIANDRLKMDYERLRKAGVIFEEKYF